MATDRAQRASRLVRLLTWGRLAAAPGLRRAGIHVLRNQVYTGDQRLDLYVPPGPGPHPMVLYVHGGGFSVLSKDTHWMMARAFARRGYLVANINYRLAPRFPFPAALQDCVAALSWLWEHGPAYGGDLQRLVLAGDSAGANLVTALTVASTWARPEPYARALFDSPVRIAAVVPACGILQVSDPGRFARRKPHLPPLLDGRIRQVSRVYLGRLQGADAALADPLLVVEGAAPPARPLPPFFIPVGTRDPLLDDSRRLHRALQARAVPAEIAYYPGGIHAFHALWWQPNARACWEDTERFLRATWARLGAAA